MNSAYGETCSSTKTYLGLSLSKSSIIFCCRSFNLYIICFIISSMQGVQLIFNEDYQSGSVNFILMVLTCLKFGLCEFCILWLHFYWCCPWLSEEFWWVLHFNTFLIRLMIQWGILVSLAFLIVIWILLWWSSLSTAQKVSVWFVFSWILYWAGWCPSTANKYRSI